MTDADLIARYERCLHGLVRKSFLSHPSIAMVLEDMLRSDLAMLWQLIGAPQQADPFEDEYGGFMDKVQARANADPRVRHAVRAAILGQLQLIEGYVPGTAVQ